MPLTPFITPLLYAQYTSLACPRLNVRAVRKNVRHTVLHAVLGILAQIAQTVQHACRLLTGQLLLRCKFAIANAVYHAQRRTEQHILVLGSEKETAVSRRIYVAALFPGAVNRCRQRTEIRSGDALRVRLIDLLPAQMPAFRAVSTADLAQLLGASAATAAVTSIAADKIAAIVRFIENPPFLIQRSVIFSLFWILRALFSDRCIVFDVWYLQKVPRFIG